MLKFGNTDEFFLGNIKNCIKTCGKMYLHYWLGRRMKPLVNTMFALIEDYFIYIIIYHFIFFSYFSTLLAVMRKFS